MSSVFCRRERPESLSPWARDRAIFVREVSALEGVTFLEELRAVPDDDERKKVVVMAAFASLVLQEEDGKAVFADADVAMTAPIGFLEAVCKAAMLFNKLAQESQEGVEKNSKGAR